MARTRRTIWAAFAALVIAMLCTVPGSAEDKAPDAKAAPPKVNVGSMVTEMMKMQLEGNQQQLVMWMPFEFFVACGTAQGDSWEEASKAMATFKDYNVVCVMREVTNADGTNTYASADQVQKSTFLRGADGEEVKPLATVPAKVSAMATVMRQSMAAQGGPQAENMRLLFFPRQSNGKDIGSANDKGKFVIELQPVDNFEASTITYHTPFDALRPQHVCPHCKESISAKWSFCPWCGTKQEDAEK